MISKMKMPRRLLTALAALLLGVVMTVGVPPTNAYAASGTITGSVDCFYGNGQEVGVWVNATNGTDGWATLTPGSYGETYYSYTLSQSSTYTLHVGCSGTPQNWGATMYTPVVNGNHYTWVCSYTPSMGFFCAMS